MDTYGAKSAPMLACLAFHQSASSMTTPVSPGSASLSSPLRTDAPYTAIRIIDANIIRQAVPSRAGEPVYLHEIRTSIELVSGVPNPDSSHAPLYVAERDVTHFATESFATFSNLKGGPSRVGLAASGTEFTGVDEGIALSSFKHLVLASVGLGDRFCESSEAATRFENLKKGPLRNAMVESSGALTRECTWLDRVNAFLEVPGGAPATSSLSLRLNTIGDNPSKITSVGEDQIAARLPGVFYATSYLANLIETAASEHGAKEPARRNTGIDSRFHFDNFRFIVTRTPLESGPVSEARTLFSKHFERLSSSSPGQQQQQVQAVRLVADNAFIAPVKERKLFASRLRAHFADVDKAALDRENQIAFNIINYAKTCGHGDAQWVLKVTFHTHHDKHVIDASQFRAHCVSLPLQVLCSGPGVEPELELAFPTAAETIAANLKRTLTRDSGAQGFWIRSHKTPLVRDTTVHDKAVALMLLEKLACDRLETAPVVPLFWTVPTAVTGGADSSLKRDYDDALGAPLQTASKHPRHSSANEEDGLDAAGFSSPTAVSVGATRNARDFIEEEDAMCARAAYVQTLASRIRISDLACVSDSCSGDVDGLNAFREATTTATVRCAIRDFEAALRGGSNSRTSFEPFITFKYTFGQSRVSYSHVNLLEVFPSGRDLWINVSDNVPIGSDDLVYRVEVLLSVSNGSSIYKAQSLDAACGMVRSDVVRDELFDTSDEKEFFF